MSDEELRLIVAYQREKAALLRKQAADEDNAFAKVLTHEMANNAEDHAKYLAMNLPDDPEPVAQLLPITRLQLAKECVERGLITTPEQYIRAVEGPKR